ILALIACAGALLNLGICLAVAPRWGLVAVAWATPAAYALMAGLGTWQANRIFRVPFEWSRLARLGILVAVLFVADQRAAAYGVLPFSVTGVALKLVLLLSLPVVLVATGFFRAGELRALRELLPVVTRSR